MSEKNEFVEAITDPKEGGKNIKLIFDHIRNYAIASSVMLAGAYTLKNGSASIGLPYIGWITGSMLVLSGFLLYAFNFIVVVRLLAGKKFSGNRFISFSIYLLFALCLCFAAGDFTFAILLQALKNI
ncbi:hypothetical protein ACQ0MK_11975 [Thalassospira lucentensis]|uniref:hypothetical protein n=1 Tax=Thalassospira lucentensis TaxID=168935 RepID=UPI003D2EEA04